MNRRTLSILAGILVVALGSVAAGGKAPDNQKGGAKVEAPAPVTHEDTALCVDGTWSKAASRQGACSGHGGIKEWFGKPPKGAHARCKDGTYSKSKDTQGACSNHGGIAFKIKESKPKK